jgi:hypothetical protein
MFLNRDYEELGRLCRMYPLEALPSTFLQTCYGDSHNNAASSAFLKIIRKLGNNSSYTPLTLHFHFQRNHQLNSRNMIKNMIKPTNK